MKKLVFARYREAVIAALFEDGGSRPATLKVLGGQSGPQAGDIVIARVNQVKKDISSAFVSIAPGQTAYLQLSDPAAYKQRQLDAMRRIEWVAFTMAGPDFNSGAVEDDVG